MPTITPRSMKIFKAHYPRTIPLSPEFIAEAGQIETKTGPQTWISNHGMPFHRGKSFGRVVSSRDGLTIPLPRGIDYYPIEGGGRLKYALTWREDDAEALADLAAIYGQKFRLISYD